ncbi:phosphatidylglycerophosphatase A family protein [Rickettsiella massiliensis]|uniref:phosphatidylglycerophosphatase A family protein n=1 Tax=Rickettsiella massiliensis TaxID=676517 RepID=UPI00029A8142|nr:phosphatidylglycerophosphatase A [Rickettsiella massiliensis]
MISCVKYLPIPFIFLAFGFGSGLSPFAPGTCGTLVAVPLYYLLQSFSLLNYSLILIAAILLGIWICDFTERDLGVHDYSGIVWDEICGFGLTMWAAPSGVGWVVCGFFLFRFFDIVKPWPIAWMDRHLPRGFGVMVDDLMAAVYAWIALHLLGHFFF